MRLLFYLFSFVLVLIPPQCTNAQTIEVTDAAGNVALVFENESLKEAGSSKTLYTVKGNIIFEGASDKQQDIKLLVDAENLFSKRKDGEVLDASQKQELFSVRDGAFFFRDSSTYDEDWMVAHYRKEENGIAMLAGNSDTLVCRIASQEVTTGKLVAVFYYFTKKLDWEGKMERAATAAAAKRPEITETPDEEAVAAVRATSGTIRKLWNTGMEEFVWDGEVLKRKWNSFDYEEWTFDGTTLKRLWYPGQEEMEWDGQVLRRKWYSSNDEFEWDGSMIRRRWGSAADGFVIQGHIVKRAFSSDIEHEWELEGDIPIPVITIVVFGLLRK